MSEQSETPTQIQDKPQNPPRRSFLKGIAGLMGLVATGQIPDISSKEKETFSPKVTVIDMASSVPIDGTVNNLLQKKSVTNENGEREFVKGFLDRYFTHGDDVATVLQNELKKQGLGIDGIHTTPLQRIFDSTSLQFLENDELGNPRAQFTIAPERVIKLLRGDQNKVVNMSFQVGDIETTLKRFVLGKSPDKENKLRLKYHPHELESDGVFYLNVDFNRSDIKNSNFIDFDGNKIIPLTKDELGKLKEHNEGLWKQEIDEYNALPDEEVKPGDNPYFAIHGAYTREKTSANLPKLFEVCNAFSDKLFVVALGNEGEDIREALDKFGDKRPKNLLIVGQWGSDLEPRDQPKYSSYGADIYVDNEKYGYKSGSSFSTPVIAAYASSLMARGLTIDQAIRKVKASCVTKTYLPDSELTETKVLVFNPELDHV